MDSPCTVVLGVDQYLVFTLFGGMILIFGMVKLVQSQGVDLWSR